MSDDARIVIGGWPLPYDWTLADLRRIRRELEWYTGPDRGEALARLDELIRARRG